MKSKTITALLIILLTSTIIVAQPLPPSGPSGNPVPVGSLNTILLLAGSILLLQKKRKS
ncbi:MAG: hypothetical protein ACERKD_08060 [Prolixibacteraceae bacterium]